MTSSLSTIKQRHVQLAALVAAILAGCNGGVDQTEGAYCGPATYESTLSEVLEEPDLTMIRESYTDADERCEAACELLHLQSSGTTNFTIKLCEAAPPDGAADDPWDPSQTTITIECTLVVTELAGCGRRPHGHHELDAGPPSTGAWLRAQAHLERASVAAFDELGAWLEGRGAPPDLIERCRASAADEVVHADLFDALLRREAIEPPPVAADPCAPSPLEVALHNAAEGCVSESFGALIGAYQAEHAGAPELRAIFQRLAGDEVRHGQLAWDLHVYLLDELDPAAQARVREHLDDALARLPQRARAQATAAPREIGWPPPDEAAALARSFVAGLREQLGWPRRIPA